MCARTSMCCVCTRVCTCCSVHSLLSRCPRWLQVPAPPSPPPLAVKHRHVFKTCGPDGQWVTGPRGQSLRDATQCELDAEDLEAQVGRAGAAGAGLPALPGPLPACSACPACPARCSPCPCLHLLPPSPGEICQDLRQLQGDVHRGLLRVPVCADPRPGPAAGFQVGPGAGARRGGRRGRRSRAGPGADAALLAASCTA